MGTEFHVKDCALAVLATGEKAASLPEFRTILASIHPSSIYHHFWGGRLSPSFTALPYFNDFAHWADQALHDRTLAERLSVIDPTNYPNLETLREVILEIIDERFEEIDYFSWSHWEQRFHFLRSRLIVFHTTQVIREPKELQEVLPSLSHGSLFYHFIDARRRTESHCDDFSFWLEKNKEIPPELLTEIRSIDPYFLPLGEVKNRVQSILESYVR